jgi:hypothetical protein
MQKTNQPDCRAQVGHSIEGRAAAPDLHPAPGASNGLHACSQPDETFQAGPPGDFNPLAKQRHLQTTQRKSGLYQSSLREQKCSRRH